MVKVNANELVLVFYNILNCINPIVTKKRNLKIVKVKLVDLLYLIILHASLCAITIILTSFCLQTNASNEE
jgi:hypothetical protein